MRNPQVDGQESHTRPFGLGELAQHSETVRFHPAGKWGDCAGEDCDLKAFFDTVKHDPLRLYYWKQWKGPRTRRRNLLKLGANPKKVHMATRSRKGYWRMSRNTIVHQGLNNRWLKERGVPEMRDIWIKLNYGDKSRPVPGV